MPRIELKKEPTLLSAALICDKCASRSGLGIPLDDSFTKIAATYMMGAMPKLADGGIGYDVPGVFLCAECAEKEAKVFGDVFLRIGRMDKILEPAKEGGK